jgi:hypothetical protein
MHLLQTLRDRFAGKLSFLSGMIGLSSIETREVAIPEEVLDQYRHTNVEHDDWWDCTYDDFTKRMHTTYGVEVEDIQFSNFWSQGNGASFTGYVSDLQKFLSFFPSDYPMIHMMWEDGGEVHLRLTRGLDRRYCHENTVYLDISTSIFMEILEAEDADPLRHAVALKWDKQLDDEVAHLSRVGQDFLRNRMGELYRDLESEYEYLTSDEAVRETIIANDLYQPTEEN